MLSTPPLEFDASLLPQLPDDASVTDVYGAQHPFAGFVGNAALDPELAGAQLCRVADPDYGGRTALHSMAPA